jgi:hypothetical protein
MASMYCPSAPNITRNGRLPYLGTRIFCSEVQGQWTGSDSVPSRFDELDLLLDAAGKVPYCQGISDQKWLELDYIYCCIWLITYSSYIDHVTRKMESRPSLRDYIKWYAVTKDRDQALKRDKAPFSWRGWLALPESSTTGLSTCHLIAARDWLKRSYY